MWNVQNKVVEHYGFYPLAFVIIFNIVYTSDQSCMQTKLEIVLSIKSDLIGESETVTVLFLGWQTKTSLKA